MTIIKYNNSHNILVEFEQGCITTTTYQHFCSGKVKNIYDKRVCGIGYLGGEKYKKMINNVLTPQYEVWRSMLKRCYDIETQKRQPTYTPCSVDEVWHNYQCFGEWYDKFFYTTGETMQLDKDILKKNNKIYGPDFCVFVPRTINNLINKNKGMRGKWPIGVHYDKNAKKFVASCGIGNGHQKTIGHYTTPEEAFYIYKEFKENIIKETAEKYKGQIPDKLYNALMSYEVEITD